MLLRPWRRRQCQWTTMVIRHLRYVCAIRSYEPSPESILILREIQRILVDAGAIPPYPPSIEVVDRSDSSLTVQVSGLATHYLFRHRNATASGEWVNLPRHDAGGNFHDTGLAPDSTYYYQAQSCGSGGCSEFSQETGGVTESAGQVNPPAAPTVQGEKIDVPYGGDDARVTWIAIEGATYYEVYQGSNLDAEISAPRTTYRDGSPNRAVFGEYSTTSYRVKACNKAGCSPFSEIVTIR